MSSGMSFCFQNVLSFSNCERFGEFFLFPKNTIVIKKTLMTSQLPRFWWFFWLLAAEEKTPKTGQLVFLIS
jgi:hypothetical protein